MTTMRLDIKALCKITLLSMVFAIASMSCVSAKPLSKVPKASEISTVLQTNQEDSKINQDLKLEFYTTYDSDAKCDQRNFGFTWQKVKDDLANYNIGMDKIEWLFAPSICTKVITPKYDHVLITGFRDKNSPLYVYYIHHTKENKRVLAKIHRQSSIQLISKGRREYLGDIDTFSEGKFILDQFINTKNDFY